MTGMYSAVAILSALRHRDRTGQGQHIDVALLDVQVAWLANQGLNYLTGGEVPKRLGTGHPNTVPYQAFRTQDGEAIIGCNNDDQFRRFCALVDRADLSTDERFATNAARVRNREAAVAAVQEITAQKPTRWWMEELARINIMCAPIHTLVQVFEDPQIQHREMKISMPHPAAGRGSVDLLGNPLKLSETPVSYRRTPPMLGEHTDELLEELLQMDSAERDALRRQAVI
jgi:crotonobetainyl-CoA:carnitine CoA-transferase CaiB-like acyl-CoA transferase